MTYEVHPRAGSLCISIGSQAQADGRMVARLQERFYTVVRLSFDDTEGKDIIGHPFDAAMARDVLRAASRITASNHVMVHCEGGVSRSVAVAVFLAAMLQREVKLHRAPDITQANMLVLQQLKRAYFLDCLRKLNLPRWRVVTARAAA